MINRGLNEINWKSLHLSDYIEECDQLICHDVSQALETVQNDVKIIREIALNWSQIPSDIFDQQSNYSLWTFHQTLRKHQFVNFILFYFVCQSLIHF